MAINGCGRGNGFSIGCALWKVDLEVKIILASKNRAREIGWIRLEVLKTEGILDGADGFDYFYLVHSYFEDAEDNNLIMGKTEYILSFVLGIVKKHVHGNRTIVWRQKVGGACR